MSKKSYAADEIPSLVAERLVTWGECIRTQRLTQRIPATELCLRVGVSHPTLLRMQRGDPAVGVGLYLAAMLVLGILHEIAPPPALALWQADGSQRVRNKAGEQIEEHAEDGDDDYF